MLYYYHTVARSLHVDAPARHVVNRRTFFATPATRRGDTFVDCCTRLRLTRTSRPLVGALAYHSRMGGVALGERTMLRRRQTTHSSDWARRGVPCGRLFWNCARLRGLSRLAHHPPGACNLRF